MKLLTRNGYDRRIFSGASSRLLKTIGMTVLITVFMLTNASAQKLENAGWTGWMAMNQQNCMNRAKQVFTLAKVRITEEVPWSTSAIYGAMHMKIKCVADDNSARLVNRNVRRVLVDVDVVGMVRTRAGVETWRNCLSDHMRRGSNNCWKPAVSKPGTLSQMKIYAKQGWQNTRVRVKPGDRIKLTVIGNVQYTPRKSAPNGGRCGPVGVKGFETYTVNRAWNHCAVIGRIGRQMFLVGLGKTITVTQAGFLELRVNDTDLGNNAGAFTSSITLYSK